MKKANNNNSCVRWYYVCHNTKVYACLIIPVNKNSVKDEEVHFLPYKYTKDTFDNNKHFCTFCYGEKTQLE